MNILVASPYSINSYSRGIMPDVLQTQIDRHPKATIYYLSCSHSFNSCYFNIQKNPDVCYRCKTGVKNTLKLIKGNFQHITINDIISSADNQKMIDFFQDKSSISFQDYYEDFEVGEATLSTYISTSRDRDLKYVEQPYVLELAGNALRLYLGLQRFLVEKQIDKVFNFNGRQDYVRAIWKASASKNITCYNVERTRMGGNIDFYKDELPHSISYRSEFIEGYWSNSPLSLAEKKKIGCSFFERQRSGESVIFPSYTKKMLRNFVPDFLKNGNKNIVVFNSSDDEMAALGKIFSNPFFKDQLEGLQYLTSLMGKELPNKNLIIRMHPNLIDVEHSFSKRIRDLHQSYPNVFVLAPESSVDTYALMQAAEKVITFGSTTGLEANFMGKPVILLGKSFYESFNVAYQPEHKKNILNLLKISLKPKPKEGAIKFGYYYLKGGQTTKYYKENKIGEGVYFKGKRIHTYSFLERVCSKIIQKAYSYFGIRINF